MCWPSSPFRNSDLEYWFLLASNADIRSLYEKYGSGPFFVSGENRMQFLATIYNIENGRKKLLDALSEPQKKTVEKLEQRVVNCIKSGDGLFEIDYFLFGLIALATAHSNKEINETIFGLLQKCSVRECSVEECSVSEFFFMKLLENTKNIASTKIKITLYNAMLINCPRIFPSLRNNKFIELIFADYIPATIDGYRTILTTLLNDLNTPDKKNSIWFSLPIIKGREGREELFFAAAENLGYGVPSFLQHITSLDTTKDGTQNAYRKTLWGTLPFISDERQTEIVNGLLSGQYINLDITLKFIEMCFLKDPDNFKYLKEKAQTELLSKLNIKRYLCDIIEQEPTLPEKHLSIAETVLKNLKTPEACFLLLQVTQRRYLDRPHWILRIMEKLKTQDITVTKKNIETALKILGNIDIKRIVAGSNFTLDYLIQLVSDFPFLGEKFLLRDAQTISTIEEKMSSRIDLMRDEELGNPDKEWFPSALEKLPTGLFKNFVFNQGLEAMATSFVSNPRENYLIKILRNITDEQKNLFIQTVMKKYNEISDEGKKNNIISKLLGNITALLPSPEEQLFPEIENFLRWSIPRLDKNQLMTLLQPLSDDHKKALLTTENIQYIHSTIEGSDLQYLQLLLSCLPPDIIKQPEFIKDIQLWASAQWSADKNYQKLLDIFSTLTSYLPLKEVILIFTHTHDSPEILEFSYLLTRPLFTLAKTLDQFYQALILVYPDAKEREKQIATVINDDSKRESFFDYLIRCSVNIGPEQYKIVFSFLPVAECAEYFKRIYKDQIAKNRLLILSACPEDQRGDLLKALNVPVNDLLSARIDQQTSLNDILLVLSLLPDAAVRTKLITDRGGIDAIVDKVKNMDELLAIITQLDFRTIGKSLELRHMNRIIKKEEDFYQLLNEIDMQDGLQVFGNWIIEKLDSPEKLFDAIAAIKDERRILPLIKKLNDRNIAKKFLMENNMAILGPVLAKIQTKKMQLDIIKLLGGFGIFKNPLVLDLVLQSLSEKTQHEFQAEYMQSIRVNPMACAAMLNDVENDVVKTSLIATIGFPEMVIDLFKKSPEEAATKLFPALLEYFPDETPYQVCWLTEENQGNLREKTIYVYSVDGEYEYRVLLPNKKETYQGVFADNPFLKNCKADDPFLKENCDVLIQEVINNKHASNTNSKAEFINRIGGADFVVQLIEKADIKSCAYIWQYYPKSRIAKLEEKIAFLDETTKQKWQNAKALVKSESKTVVETPKGIFSSLFKNTQGFPKKSTSSPTKTKNSAPGK